jgi:hypothetical protein
MTRPAHASASFHAAVSIGISNYAVDASDEGLVAPDPSGRNHRERFGGVDCRKAAENAMHAREREARGSASRAERASSKSVLL